jgi:transcriptional regulator with XRE-family HTH domain
MVTRINVGPKVVASDDAIARPFDVEHSFSGDAVVYPFGDRLRRDTKGASEVRLRSEGSEDGVQNVVAHGSNVIHGQFMSVNRHVIERQPAVYDHGRMPHRIPQPENFASFAAWVTAMYAYAGSQAALARAVGVSPQMITKYLKGRSIEPENLEKFAQYSGVSYGKLRLLVEGKLATEAKNIKERFTQTATPQGAQVGRQWEQIHDERVRDLIAEQIKMALEQQARLEVASRKRAV